MRLLIIRPEPGASATATRVIMAGYDPVLLPFFDIIPSPWEIGDHAEIDALLFSSANAVRNAGTSLDALRHLPVYAVGERTASALAEIGIDAAAVGSAGIDESLEDARAAGHNRLLWLAGEDHQSPCLPEGMQLRIAICYSAKVKALPKEASEVMAGCDVILLHSARAARQFGITVDRLGLARGGFLLAVFSPAIAEAVGKGWRGVAIARQPADSALLSAMAELVKLNPVSDMRKE